MPFPDDLPAVLLEEGLLSNDLDAVLLVKSDLASWAYSHLFRRVIIYAPHAQHCGLRGATFAVARGNANKHGRSQNTHFLQGPNSGRIVVSSRALVVQPCCPMVLLHSRLRAVAAVVAVGWGTSWGIRK